MYPKSGTHYIAGGIVFRVTFIDIGANEIPMVHVSGASTPNAEYDLDTFRENFQPYYGPVPPLPKLQTRYVAEDGTVEVRWTDLDLGHGRHAYYEAGTGKDVYKEVRVKPEETDDGQA